MTITETKIVYTLNINTFKELYKNFVYLSDKYINNDVCGNKKFLLLILLVAIYFGKETRMINENINLQNILQQQQVFSLLKGGASNRKTKKNRKTKQNGKTKQNRKTKQNGKTKKKMKGGNLLLRFLICLGIVIFLVLIRPAYGINKAAINRDEFANMIEKMLNNENVIEKFFKTDNKPGMCPYYAASFSGVIGSQEDYKNAIMDVQAGIIDSTKNTIGFWPVMASVFKQNIYETVFYQENWDGTEYGTKEMVDKLQEYFVKERQLAVNAGDIHADEYSSTMLTMSGHIMPAFATPNGGMFILEPARFVDSIIDWGLYKKTDAYEGFLLQYKFPLDGNTKDWDFWNEKFPGAFGIKEEEYDGVTEFVHQMNNNKKDLKLSFVSNKEPKHEFGDLLIDANVPVPDRISFLPELYNSDNYASKKPSGLEKVNIGPVRTLTNNILVREHEAIAAETLTSPPPREIMIGKNNIDMKEFRKENKISYNKENLIKLIAGFDDLSLDGALPADPNININQVLIIPPEVLLSVNIINVKEKVGKLIKEAKTKQKQDFLITRFEWYINAIKKYPTIETWAQKEYIEPYLRA